MQKTKPGQEWRLCTYFSLFHLQNSPSDSGWLILDALKVLYMTQARGLELCGVISHFLISLFLLIYPQSRLVAFQDGDSSCSVSSCSVLWLSQRSFLKAHKFLRPYATWRYKEQLFWVDLQDRGIRVLPVLVAEHGGLRQGTWLLGKRTRRMRHWTTSNNFPDAVKQNMVVYSHLVESMLCVNN